MHRIYLTHVSAIIAGLCLYSLALADRGKELGDFSRVLDTACQRNDVASLVRLAASTKGKDLWHMAMGVGPGDDASLRMRALMVREHLLLDKSGLLRDEIVADLGDNLSQAETELLTQLRVDPTDTTQMLKLLSNPDPSVRWIGIYKTRFIAAPSTSLVQALRGVAAQDDFVILADVPGRGPPSAALHPEGAREFIAPLRTMANDQLAKWNEQVPENPQDVARTGLRRLLKDYAADPKRHHELLWAVSRLHPEFSPIAKTELDRLTPENPDQQHTVSAFKKAAASQ